MTPPPEPRPCQHRDCVRRQAHLDVERHAKLEALAKAFHRKRAQILRHVMQWGLTHRRGWATNPSMPDRPHLVHLLVDHDLLQQARDAADTHGASAAAWLRHAIRRVTPRLPAELACGANRRPLA